MACRWRKDDDDELLYRIQPSDKPFAPLGFRRHPSDIFFCHSSDCGNSPSLPLFSFFCSISDRTTRALPSTHRSAAIMSDHHSDDGQHASAPSYSNRSFGRLQIFHPISLLLLVASLALTTLVVSPTMNTVAGWHPTFFNPNETWLLGYWALLLLLQVGTALSVVLASGQRTKVSVVARYTLMHVKEVMHVKEGGWLILMNPIASLFETQALMTNGISLWLPISNLLIAIWAPLFILNQRPAFMAGEVAIGLAMLMLLISTLVTGILQSYRPTWKRPIEWLLVHTPVRMFLAVLLQVDFWQQGYIALGLADEGAHSLKRTVWPTFIIVVSTGVASALWTFATTDIAFGAATIYLQLAMLFHRKVANHRPAEIFAAHILSIALVGTALLAGTAWGRLTSRQEGRIALPIDPHEEAAVAQAEVEAEAAEQRAKARRDEAERLRGEGGHGGSSSSSTSRRDGEPTPSQLERGENVASPKKKGGSEDGPAVTRKLGSK